ncbi:MAG: VWA domain-containing protein [Bernardetiaceae bacterium]
MPWITRFICVSMLLALSFGGIAQRKPEKIPKTTRILFVLDASGSMRAQWNGRQRIDIARETLIRLMDSLTQQPNIEVGLRIYGHQYDNRFKNCTDSKLEVGFGPANFPRLRSTLTTLNPQGVTPIAYSLEQSVNDFPPRDNVRNVIILITDGLESCGGDPCAISKGLQEKGIFLRPFVIGMGIEKEFAKAFACLGRFFNAHNEIEFHEAIQGVVRRTMGKTTVRVELLDSRGGANQKDINMSLRNAASGEVLYNIVHFRDSQNKTDLLELDPIPTYDLVINTVPPVIKRNLEIEGGRENVFRIPTPQGQLLLQQRGSTEYSNDLKAIIRKANENETVFAQSVNQGQKYLVGRYDIEVLTLPRTYYSAVSVKERETTTINIPSPGILTIHNKIEGFASIYVLRDGRRQEWVTDLDERGYKQINLTMQPGRYVLVFRPKNVVSSDYTTEKKFEIRSGSNVVVNLFDK